MNYAEKASWIKSSADVQMKSREKKGFPYFLILSLIFAIDFFSFAQYLTAFFRGIPGSCLKRSGFPLIPNYPYTFHGGTIMKKSIWMLGCAMLGVLAACSTDSESEADVSSKAVAEPKTEKPAPASETAATTPTTQGGQRPEVIPSF